MDNGSKANNRMRCFVCKKSEHINKELLVQRQTSKNNLLPKKPGIVE